MKKIIGIILVMFVFCAAHAQELFNNDITAYMSLNVKEKCIYFSSMDWFKTIDCYDEEGNQMFHSNVKKDARKQTSQFIVMKFDDFEDGEYIIILKKNRKEMIATLRIFNNSTDVQLYSTN